MYRQRQLLSLAAVVLLSYKALFHAIARMDSSSARLKRAREKTHFNVTTMFGAYGVSTKLYSKGARSMKQGFSDLLIYMTTLHFVSTNLAK